MNPVCVDPKTFVKVGDRDASGKCRDGEPDFEAVGDIHIGIVSSSLVARRRPPATTPGRLGAAGPPNNNRGHLVTRGTTGVTRGFLAFTGGDAAAVTTPFNRCSPASAGAAAARSPARVDLPLPYRP